MTFIVLVALVYFGGCFTAIAITLGDIARSVKPADAPQPQLRRAPPERERS